MIRREIAVVAVLCLVGLCTTFVGPAQAAESAWIAEDSFSIPAPGNGDKGAIDIERAAHEVSEFQGAHENYLKSDAAAREREESTDSFKDMGSEAATGLFADVFKEQLGALASLPTDALFSSDDILRFNSDRSASIDPAGTREAALVVSDVPFRTPAHKILNNSLRRVDSGFAPAAPLAEVILPPAGSGDVQFPTAEISFSFDGSSANGSQGKLITSRLSEEDDVVVYPNTGVDADTAAFATLGGVETFSILRSEESPETISMTYDLPDGAQLKSTLDGGAVAVEAGSSDPLLAIYPPYAVDAQGTNVPMSLRVDGSKIILEVPHRGHDFAYPIMVDPVQHLRDWWTNGASANYAGWAFHEVGTTNYRSELTCPAALAAIDPCGGTGAGLYTSAVPTLNYPNGSYAYWSWVPPGGTSTTILGANIGSWRYRQGSTAHGNPFAFFSITGGGSTTYVTSGGGGSNMALTGSSSGARSFNVGLSSNANVTMPTGAANYRYNRLASFAVSMTDGEPPTLELLNAPTTWIKGDTTFNVSAKAGDKGLGLGRIDTKINGTWVDKWLGWCSGTYGALCQRDVIYSVPFNSNSFTSGVQSLPIRVKDIVAGDEHHEITKNVSVKIDRYSPKVQTSGSATDQANPGPDLKIVATEGPTGALGSGIESIEVKVEGATVYDETIPCTETQGTCPQTVSREIQLPIVDLVGTNREIEVEVHDHVGNLGTETGGESPAVPEEPAWNLTTPPATYNPQPTPVRAETEACKPRSQAKILTVAVRAKTMRGDGCANIIVANENVRTIYAGGGDDIILADKEGQTVNGGGGDDLIITGRNNDPIHGDAGDDTIYGGMGDDDLWGDSGNDTIYGGHGVDTIFGDSGSDTLDGGHGSDRLIGGEDEDGQDMDVLTYASAVTPGADTTVGIGPVTGYPEQKTEERGVVVDMTRVYKETSTSDPRIAPKASNGDPRLGGGTDWLCDNRTEKTKKKLKWCYKGESGGFEVVLGSSFSDIITLDSEQKAAIGGAGGDILDGMGTQELYGGSGADVLRGPATVQKNGGPHPAGSAGDSCTFDGSSAPECERDDVALHPRVRGSSISVGTLQAANGLGSNLASLDVFDDTVSLFLDGSEFADNVRIVYNQGQHTVTFEAGEVTDGYGDTGRFASAEVQGCTYNSSTKVTCNLGSKRLSSLVVSGGEGNDSFAVSGFGFRYSSSANYSHLRSEGATSEVFLLGGMGRDYLIGGNGDDFIVDGDNQSLSAPANYRETIRGGRGSDLIIENRGPDSVTAGSGNDLIMSTAMCNKDEILGGSGLDNSQWAQLPMGEHVPEQGNEKTIREIGVYIDLSKEKLGKSYQNPDNKKIKGTSCGGRITGIDRIEASNNSDLLIGDKGHHENPNKFLPRSGRDWLDGGSQNAERTNISVRDGGEAWNQELRIDCGHGGGKVVRDGPDPQARNCSEPIKPGDPKIPDPRYGGDPDTFYTETRMAVDRTHIRDEVEDDAYSLDTTGRFGDDWESESEAPLPVALYSLAETEGVSAESQIAPEEDGSYLPVEEIAGEEVAGPDLAIEGALDGETEGAVSLDGEDDLVELTDSFEPNEIAPDGGYAVEIWARFDQGEPDDDEPLFTREGTAGGISFYRDTNGLMVLQSDTGDRLAEVSSQVPVIDGEWHQFAFSLGDESATVFVDGFPVTTGFDYDVMPAESPNAENVAGAEPESQQFANVDIDDVAIFDVALKPDDVISDLAASDVVEPSPFTLPPADEPDTDGDGVIDSIDNCPANANSGQTDENSDGFGDVCEPPVDLDDDGVADGTDNCLEWANPGQVDTDEDGVGDMCLAGPEDGINDGDMGEVQEVVEEELDADLP